METERLSDRSKPSKSIGIWYASSAYIAWGILPLYWKGLKQIPAGQILAHRIVWSFVFVALILTVTGGWGDLKKALSSIKNVLVISLGAMLISANWLIYIWAVNSDKVIEASLGYYINPLFTIVLGLMVLKEKIDTWQCISLLLALSGVILISIQYGRIPLVALSLAITFGLYGLVKKLSQLSSITALAAETLLVAPLALGYLVFLQSSGQGSFGHVSPIATLLLVCSGIATATPLLWFAQGAKRVPLSTMGFIQYLSPSISLILGVFLFKEAFTMIDLISFGLIWCALGLYSFSRKEVLIYLTKTFNGRQQSAN